MQHVKGAMAEAAAASAMASEAGAEAGAEAGVVSELGEGVASPASDASGGGEVGEAVLGDDRVVHAEKADAGDSPTEMYCGGNGCFEDKSRTKCKFQQRDLVPCQAGYSDDGYSGTFCQTRKCKAVDRSLEVAAAAGGTAAVPPTPTKLQDPDQDNLTEEMSLPE